jgi:hypothetical protein
MPALSNVENETFVDTTLSKLNVAGRHRNCRFERVQFDACVFRQTTFYECSFVDCEIRGPKISNSVFSRCTLLNTRIDSARGNRLDFWACDVTGLKISGHIDDLIFAVGISVGVGLRQIGNVLGLDLSELRCSANISGASVARMKVQLPNGHVSFPDCRTVAPRVLAELVAAEACTEEELLVRNSMESFVGRNSSLTDEWDIIMDLTYGQEFIEAFRPYYERYKAKDLTVEQETK